MKVRELILIVGVCSGCDPGTVDPKAKLRLRPLRLPRQRLSRRRGRQRSHKHLARSLNLRL